LRDAYDPTDDDVAVATAVSRAITASGTKRRLHSSTESNDDVIENRSVPGSSDAAMVLQRPEHGVRSRRATGLSPQRLSLIF